MKPIAASNRTITAGVLWAMLDSVARQALTFVVFVILARLLGPESYGLVGMALAVTMALQALGTLGLTEPLVRRQTDDLDHDSAHWAVVGCSLLLAGLIALSAPLIAAALDQPQIAVLIAALSLALPLNGASVVHGALLRKQMRFGVFAARTTLAAVIAAALAVTMAMQGQGVWALVAFQLVRATISSAFLWFACDWRPRLRVSLTRVRSLIGEGMRILGQLVSVQAAEEAPKLLIGAILGPAALGLYIMCRRLLDTATEALIAPFMTVAVPALAGARADAERMRAIYGRYLSAACLLAFPALAGAAALATDLLQVLYGPPWTAGAGAFAIVMAIGFERVMNVFSAAALNASGKAGVLLRFTLTASAVSVAATWAAAPRGLEAVAAAQAGVALCGAPALLWIMARCTGIAAAQPLRDALAIALCATAMAVGVRLGLDQIGPESALWRLLLGVAAGAALYAALVAMFARKAAVSAASLLLELTRREPAR